MSNLIKHARQEFIATGWMNEKGDYTDEMQGALCEGVINLLKMFSKQGHSGTIALYTIDLFRKLAMFEPLMPLTGEDWEWHEASPGVFQNKRCSHVFKQADRFDGQAYDIQGRVFYEWLSDEDGEMFKSSFTNYDSFVPITFPYTPTISYVEVERREQ